MARIVYDQAGQSFEMPLPGDGASLGRDPRANLVLPDAAVSRTHARILKINDTWQLQDFSSGGTLINQTLIRGGPPVVLRHGDHLRIGPYKLTFLIDDQAPRKRPKMSVSGVSIESDEQSTIQGTALTGGYGLVSVRPEDKLNGILKINEALAGNVDLHAICPRVLETLFGIFPQADRGAILLLDDANQELQPVAQKHRRPDDTSAIRISRTLLRTVLETHSAILSMNTALDPRMADSESLKAQSIHSTMCVPMHGVDGRPVGIISLDSRDIRKQFTSDDLQLIVAVANQASLAFENARLLVVSLEKLKQDHELRVSAEVQRALIPETMPEVAGYRIFGTYDAARTVGGDYYDCFAMPDGRICVSFGDVSGKGFSAALIMARLSGIVRTTLHFTDDVRSSMRQINNLMCNSMVDGRFVTYVLGVLDPTQHTFTFSNAGHMPPEIRTADGRLFNPGTDCSGPPIGLYPNYDYDVLTVPFAAGDVLVLRTDGVDEAMTSSRQQFGKTRFEECIRASPPDSEAICRNLLAAVQAFVGPEVQADDITIMAVGRMSDR